MTWTSRNVVVTGAGGFIGSHLVERLLALGANVTAFVRYNSRNDPGFLDLLAPHTKHIRIVPGDIRDPEAVRSALEGADTVFHLAALIGIPYSYVHPIEVFEVNAQGTLNVLGSRSRRIARTCSDRLHQRSLWKRALRAHRREASQAAAVALFGEQDRVRCHRRSVFTPHFNFQ